MKKSIILSLVFLISILSIKGQDYYFGPKVGINVSSFFYSGDDVATLKDMGKMKLATHIGGFVEIVFDDFFSLQPELLYSIKGANFRKSSDEEFKSAYVLKYLSLPIMGKYYVTKEISLEAGPQFAYLLSAKDNIISDEYSSNLGDEEASIDLIDQMQVFDVGAVAGIGYLTKQGLYFTARYNFGILNAHKTLADEDTILHNGTIQLSFGFSFQ